jgi:hypothetical protein
LKLTSFDNGMTIDIDPRRIVAYGPHNSGGSFINWNGGSMIHVKEKVEEILKLSDRQSTRTS